MIKEGVLFLMGIKHCGKTVLGKKVARYFDIPFFDLDHTVLRLYNERSNAPVEEISIREVYRETGREGFKRLEEEGLIHILESRQSAESEQKDDLRTVCALGGGTIENTNAMKHIEGKGLFCYIREDREILFNRIISKSGVPAFLDPENPEEDFRRLYARRTALYDNRADLTVDAAGRTIDAVFEDLLLKIEGIGKEV